MKRLIFLSPTVRTACFTACVVLVLLSGLASIKLPTVSAAPDAATYDLSWYTIDAGGVTFSTGGSYSLGGTIGQFDAGTLSNGSYTLIGGFWGGLSQYNVYLPLALKSS